jgi:hypothetical protein
MGSLQTTVEIYWKIVVSGEFDPQDLDRDKWSDKLSGLCPKKTLMVSINQRTSQSSGSIDFLETIFCWGTPETLKRPIF